MFDERAFYTSVDTNIANMISINKAVNTLVDQESDIYSELLNVSKEELIEQTAAQQPKQKLIIFFEDDETPSTPSDSINKTNLLSQISDAIQDIQLLTS